MSARPSTPPAAGAATPRTTEGCRFCWMCRQACPVGHVTARETYTPHAWALVIESVERKQMTWNAESVDVMYACADCGLCQAHCVTDQPLPDAINATRVEIARAGLAPAAVYDLDKKLRAAADGRSASRPAPVKAATVMFVGEEAASRSGNTVAAAEKLLAAAGVSSTTIAAGRSSGLLASTLGLRETAASLAAALVADVKASGATEVLVIGPADRWTFEHVYPKRLGVEWPEGVQVREVVNVLADAHAAGRLRIRQADEGRYAYHDPCHTPRLGKTRPAPRALLAAAFGPAAARNLFFREHRAHPCGAVGGLDVTHRPIADQLAAARIADAKNAGAALLVTDDPICLHQLAGHAGQGVSVKSLYEILADRM